MEEGSRRLPLRWIAAAALLMALGAGLALAVAAALDGDDGTRRGGPVAAQSETPVVARPDPATNPEAAELYDLVTRFADLTLHARYRVEVASGGGATSVVDIWQKDGRMRQEAVVEGGDGASGRLLVLDLGDRVLLCQQPPEGQYTCDQVAQGQATALESLRTGLLSGLADQDVSARDDSIDGRDVRCFVVTAQASSELCATPEGVLVRVTAPEGSFQLVDLETEVDDAIFTPPAEVGVG